MLNSGIKIYTAIDEKLYEPDSPNLTGDLIVSIIILAQAHEESLKKSKRTTGHALQMIKEHNEGKRSPEGYAYSIKSVGSEPFWVKVEGGVVKPHPELYQAAKDIIAQIKQGKGTRRILVYLRETYPQRTWSTEIPSKITSTDMLAGIKTVNLEGVEHRLTNYFPALLTLDELHQLRALRQKRHTPRSASQRISVVTGMDIAYCSNCGATVGANYAISRGSMTYFCNGKKRQTTDCEGWNLKSTYLEKGLIQLAQWIIWDSATKAQTPDFSELEQAISEKETQHQEASDLMAEYGVSKAALLQTQQLEQDIQQLNNELSAAKLEAVALPQATSEDWSKIDISFLDVHEDDKRLQLRELIRSSFSKIELYKVNRGELTIAAFVGDTPEPYNIIIKNGKVHVYHIPTAPVSEHAIDSNTYDKDKVNSWF